MLKPLSLLILAAWPMTSAWAAAPVARKAAVARKTPAQKAPVKAVAKAAPVPGQVRQWMGKLTLRQQVAQLVIIRFYGDAPSSKTKAYREFQRLVKTDGVGGLIVLNRVRNGVVVNAEPYAMAAFLNRMQRTAALPLIVGGDFERGASMRMSGTAKFPHNMAYGAARDLAATRFLGLHTAREARAMGVHWIFTPDADVNNNPDNPVIGLRAFSEDPDEVAQHVVAYIEGARSDPKTQVLLSVKHFPGHGDTAVDSHYGLPVIAADRARLDAVELKPFRAAIAAQVDSVMSSHLRIPALEPEEIPGTVSKNIMTKLLKEELGFTGLVTTDAMDMQGLSKMYSAGEAAVRAIEAGVDVLLIPANPEQAIEGVVKAVQSGRISKERLRHSVEKMLGAKVRLGLHKKRLVELEELADVLDSEEAVAQAQQVAEQALTLVRNDQGALPLKAPEKACLYVLSENRYSQLGRRLIDDVKEKSPRLAVQWLDSTMPEAAFDEVVVRAQRCSAVVLAAFSQQLSAAPTRFVEQVQQGPAPVALVSFGSPYLLRAFPKVGAYVATFSTAPTSESAVAKAILGAIPFRGRSPVTIPNLAAYGSGLE
ncbi:MAG: hypothetical protein NTZ56_16810 [Acidobacteria bacterium]|nr:hypothetical protein [Acidobacteriota bacterium]